VNITHRNEIGTLLNEMRLTGRGVEVGVHHGEYSEIILEKWQGKMLFLVDIWKYSQKNKNGDQIMNNAKIRLSRFSKRFTMIRKPSVEAANEFINNSLDFAYIDACHTYEHVKADIQAWYPKIKSGGILCGHDYCPPKHIGTTKFGIVQAVNQFLALHPEYELHLTDGIEIRPEKGDVNLQSWWIKV
jgi:cephalosporin hydroxylase